MLVDEPTELPDGTELDLIVDEIDTLDDMDLEERAELEACIDRGLAEIASGVPGIPAADLLASLRARR